MVHRTDLSLSQAIDGYLLPALAARLSEHTIADNQNGFRKLQAFLGQDTVFSKITVQQLREFVADLAKPRAPAGVAARPAKPLSKKTCLNIHAALSALWTWAVREGLAKLHLMHMVERPDPEQRAIVPLSQAEIKALLAATRRTQGYSRPGKKACDNRRATELRDRAMILLLLDTGMRASELCGLQINQVNLKSRQLKVFGKGDKERILYISAATGKAIWSYLATERKDSPANAPLFAARGGAGITRLALLRLLWSLGEKAGIEDCHPHRFRHTYAVNFLRNGGTVFALQMSMGHTTMEMVKRYLALAEADLEAAHKQASPVENWRL